MIRGVLSSAPASSLLLPGICLLTQRDPCWGVWNRGWQRGLRCLTTPAPSLHAGLAGAECAVPGKGGALISFWVLHSVCRFLQGL